jgi:outer membrane protein OmpA-like peptidoglycan-associated protein
MPKKSIAAIRVNHASTVKAGLVLVVILLPAAARAQDVGVKLEPGIAIPLSAPQSRIYDVGGAESLKLLFGLTPYLDIGPTASFLMLPAAAAGGESGVVWALGGGLRIKRPHDAKSAYGISPWLDADALYMRTGELNRPGFDAALGLAVPLGRTRAFWAGPFVRYMQTLQPDRAGFDNRDAKILIVGISLEAGAGIERPREPTPAPAEIVTKEVVVTKEVIVPKDVPYCADQDKDGVPDSVDRCPDVAGTAEAWGCPKYEKVVVGAEKLELKEKVYFAFDKATVKPDSYPLLDQVVKVLLDNKSFYVRVEGHTDSVGTIEHNQTLSKQRAAAVTEYLAAHGVPKDHLTSQGFAASVPLDTNKTAAGRENNRRVEFVLKLNTATAGSNQ